MKNVIYLMTLVGILYMGSCKEDVYCDNAQVCVKNIGSDTIRFCWGCNMHDEVIPPGEKACTYVGVIEITHGLGGSSASTETISFQTSGYTLMIEVDECYEERSVD